MSTLAASSYPAPPRRALALLVVLVLIVHTLVLTFVPAHFGLGRDTAPLPARPFVTRSVAPPPPAPQPEAAPAPARKPPVAATAEPAEEDNEVEPVRVPKQRPADYVPLSLIHI